MDSLLNNKDFCHFSHQPDEREGTEGTQDIDLDSDVGIDVSSEYSDGSLAVPTNWKVIMITSGVSGDTERLQWSIMTGVAGCNSVTHVKANWNEKIGDVKNHWDKIKFEHNVMVIITIPGSLDGFYGHESTHNAPKVVLESLLGDNLGYIERRREAYFGQGKRQEHVGETWGAIISCATWSQTMLWRRGMKEWISSWQVGSDRHFIQLNSARFTHSLLTHEKTLLTHEETVMAGLATKVVAYFLSLVSIGEQDGRYYDYEGYVGTLARAMFATERRLGMAIIRQNKTALLRWGNMASRPFGLNVWPCRPGETCDSGRTFLRIGEKTSFGTRQVYWECAQHGEVVQTFSRFLVGWWLSGGNGHLARWSELINAPLPM